MRSRRNELSFIALLAGVAALPFDAGFTLILWCVPAAISALTVLSWLLR